VEVSRAGPLALNGLGRGSAVVFLDRLPTDDAWQTTRKLGLESAKQDGFWQEAKNHFNTLKIAVLESPDLTQPDAKRLNDEYLNEMRSIRQGGAEEALLKSEEHSPDALKLYQEIAKELDQLDEL
jgi:hypothetical protein